LTGRIVWNAVVTYLCIHLLVLIALNVIEIGELSVKQGMYGAIIFICLIFHMFFLFTSRKSENQAVNQVKRDSN